MNGAHRQIAFRFHARDVHLVMRARARGASVPFLLLVDGKAPDLTHGLDVDERGYGTLVRPRLHQLIRERDSIADRTCELDFRAPGVEACVFTFG